MLSTLAIKNFVLIEDAELHFADGLNVLTGETGAGKTLLTKALGLLMGERAEEGLVGNRASDASIQAVFELTHSDIDGLPEELVALLGGVEPGPFIVTRRLGKEGRNRCFINDAAVTLALMGVGVAGLLSFAGQHEYRRLLDPRYQLAVLDLWAGPGVVKLAADYRVAHQKATDAIRRLAQIRKDEESRLRELDLLRFQAKELSEAALSLEEEKDLIAEQKVLARAEDLVRVTGGAASLLTSDEDAVDVGTLLSQALSLLGSVDGVDPTLDDLDQSLTDIAYQVEEVSRELHSYTERVSLDPARLEMVNERLRLYTELARKYGGTTESAVEHLREAEERLELLQYGEEDVSRLEQTREEQMDLALRLASALTSERSQAIPRLESAVADQLSGLGMSDATVSIRMVSAADWEQLKESGADSVEFMLAANRGLPARSLAKTASGGELSRVLLAIKCALAGVGGAETLVFDEIDAGIGGRTAVAVGRKLRELANDSQLLVITHLAQVAALASCHFVIDKVSGERDTVARLSALTESEIVQELCRMLGGGPDDQETLNLAREMRDRAVAGLLD